jgi:hypothetical protein
MNANGGHGARRRRRPREPHRLAKGRPWISAPICDGILMAPRRRAAARPRREERDFEPGGPADPLTVAPARLRRDMDVETALRATRGLYPEAEVRILNWQRPKRDV